MLKFVTEDSPLYLRVQWIDLHTEATHCFEDRQLSQSRREHDLEEVGVVLVTWLQQPRAKQVDILPENEPLHSSLPAPSPLILVLIDNCTPAAGFAPS